MRKFYKKKRNIDFINYLFQYYWVVNEGEHGFCGLCGNTGIVETNPKNPYTQTKQNFKSYCICPNGQCSRDGDTKKI